jgi:hypothetical protein
LYDGAGNNHITWQLAQQRQIVSPPIFGISTLKKFTAMRPGGLDFNILLPQDRYPALRQAI